MSRSFHSLANSVACLQYFALLSSLHVSMHVLPEDLSYSRLNPRFIQTLMDAFRGFYKLKPNWLQSFSAMYLWANFISILFYYFLETLLYHSGMVYILNQLVALANPYKKKWHNRINAFLATISVNIYLESKLLKR